MSKTVYDYMDWPEIEAVVYGEETAPTWRSQFAAVIFPLNKTPNVETTLSFAINPLSKDVTILQSPNPNGDNKGAMNPATIAKII